MFGFPLEVITMLVSTLGGAYIRMSADTKKDIAEERIARATGMQDARNFKTAHANWTRRFITIAMIGMAYIILIAPFFSLPTVVPVEATEGFKIAFLDFTTKTTEYVTLNGIVTPDYLPFTITSIIGFYFGNSMARRY